MDPQAGLRSDPRGHARAALALYEAIGRDPGDERGHCGAIAALMAAGQHGEAAASVKELILLRPGAGYQHGVMGCVVEMAGRAEDALACYGMMIEADPGEVHGRLRKSIVLISLGRGEQARECLDEMAAADPPGAPAARDKGRITGLPRGGLALRAVVFDAGRVGRRLEQRRGKARIVAGRAPRQPGDVPSAVGAGRPVPGPAVQARHALL